MIPHFFAFLLDRDVATAWDNINRALVTLSSAGVIALLALVWRMRDDVRDLKKERSGERLDALEDWRLREETIDEIEKELLHDIGRPAQRLRDKIHHRMEGERT